MASIKITEKEAKKLFAEEQVETKEEKEETKNATIRIVGNALVLTSKLKLDEIKTIEKYIPKALTIQECTGDEEFEIFRLASGKVENISKYGIIFNNTNKDGFAQITTLIPTEVENKLEYTKDKLFPIIHKLRFVETNVEEVLKQLNKELNDLEEEIVEE